MRTRSKAKAESREVAEEIIINEKNFVKTAELLENQKNISIRLENIHTSRAATKILQLKEQEITRKIFNLVWNHQSLHSLHIYRFNLGCINHKTFSTLPSEIKSLSVAATGLSEEQVVSLLTAISSQDSLKHLSLEEEGLADADKDILAAAVGKLEKISIRDCDMDSEQVEAILSCGNLSEVTISGTEDNPVFIAEVTPVVLAKGVTAWHKATISDAVVTKEQIETILQKVLSSSTVLGSLVLSNLVQEDESRITQAMFRPLVSKVQTKLSTFKML